MADPILSDEDAGDSIDGASADAGDPETGGSDASVGTISVAEVYLKVIGESPAMAMGLALQAAAHSAGLMFQNATLAQQQGQRLADAINAQSIGLIEAAGQALTARIAHFAATDRSAGPGVTPSPEV
jgi:hypothetical protein